MTAVSKVLTTKDYDPITVAGEGSSYAEYVRNSVSDNTRRAYRADLDHFLGWGGSLPSQPEQIAQYVAAHAGLLSVSTLTRRLAAIAKAHRRIGEVTPTSDELVRATMRGIKRQFGVAQRQAIPLMLEDLVRVLAGTGGDLRSIRDRALLIVGFAGAFRRSELVALRVSDVEWVNKGVFVVLRRSKTDQVGAGRTIAIPYGRGRWCPVRELEEWLEAAHLEQGPIFRRIEGTNRVSPSSLSGEAVSAILKRRLEDVGFDGARYSGHSLRAGFATSAARAGASSWRIRSQTGHASDAMLQRYVREADLFRDNAVGLLF